MLSSSLQAEKRDRERKTTLFNAGGKTRYFDRTGEYQELTEEDFHLRISFIYIYCLYIYIYIFVHTHIDIYIYIYIYPCTYLYLCLSVYINIFICICVCKYIWYINKRIYIYINEFICVSLWTKRSKRKFLSLGLVSDCVVVYNILNISFDLLRQEDKDYVPILYFVFLLLLPVPLDLFFFLHPRGIKRRVTGFDEKGKICRNSCD